MRIFKTKYFAKWACKEGLKDQALITAVKEIENGQVDANYGGNVFKKRIGINNQGKRGAIRTIIGFKSNDKTFFLHAFKKGAKSNISPTEEKALKKLAKDFFSLTDKNLLLVIKDGELYEVEVNNNGKVDFRSRT